MNKWHVKIIWILNIQGTKFQDKDSKDKDKKDEKKEDKKSDDKKKDDDEKSGVWTNINHFAVTRFDWDLFPIKSEIKASTKI